MPITIQPATLKYKKSNGQYQSADCLKGDKGDPGSVGIIAPNYADLTFPVAQGQPCIHEGLYYIANSAIQSSEDWTAAHWTGLTVGEDIRLVKSAIHGTDDYINDKFEGIADFSKNLLVLKNNSITGALQSDGTISTAGAYANYITSNFIELNPNRTYSIAVVMKNDASNRDSMRRIVLCYDRNKNIISNSYQNGFDVLKVSNVPYVRISCESIVLDSEVVGAVMVEGTTITEYVDAYLQPINKMQIVPGYGAAMQTEMDKVKTDLDGIYHIEESSNLADPSKYTIGGIQSDGTVSTAGAWENYNTTALIPLEPNTNYTISLWLNGSLNTDRIIYLLYTSEDAPVSSTFYNNSNYDHVTFNSSTYKYIRAACTQSRNIMIAKGTEYSTYVEYSQKYVTDCFLGDSAIGQVKNIISGGEEIKLLKNADNFEVTSVINGKTLKRIYKLQNYGNLLFNYGNAYLNGAEIKSSNDDITPIRVKVNGVETKPVGANHGWPFAYVGNNGAGFNASDVGSVWTDGTTQYVMLAVSDTSIYLVPPVTKSNDMIYCTMTDPAADLTHVSGATHTSNIAKSSLSKGQLYPSVNNHTLAILLDGKPLTENGTYYPSEIVVKEKYGIIDLYELYNYALENVGSVDYDAVQTICTMMITQKITGNSEVVYTNLYANENMELGECGFVQAGVLTANGGTLYRYVNGVDTGVFESTSLVDMTNYNTTTIIYPADTKQNQVPNRSVDLCINNGNVLYGFALGYIPDMGDGADSKRIGNTRLWDMRDTKKSYPICIYVKSMSAGDQVNVIGYRTYFGTVDGATDVYQVDIGNKKYIVFDAHSKVSGSVNVDKLGFDIDTVNKDGIDIGDFVNGNGVTYRSNGNYSAFVVKV